MVLLWRAKKFGRKISKLSWRLSVYFLATTVSGHRPLKIKRTIPSPKIIIMEAITYWFTNPLIPANKTRMTQKAMNAQIKVCVNFIMNNSFFIHPSLNYLETSMEASILTLSLPFIKNV